MTQFLLFTLCAPLAAMGDISVGERRMGWSRPGRSAIFGLIAGAMGIEREDEAGHQALNNGYGYAVRTDSAGTSLMDYHTAQSPMGKKARNRPTRRAELGQGDLGTILSTREYRVDACFTVAIWQWSEGGRPLNDISDALAHPCFTPYFGRKSCPFGVPFAPRTIDSVGLAEAFCDYEPFAQMTPPLLALSVERMVAFEADETINQPDPIRVETRRDKLNSRRHWLYSEREELISMLVGRSAPQ